MKIIKRITEVPVTVMIAVVATLITVLLLAINGDADPTSIGLLLLIGLGVGLQAHYGSVVIKTIASILMILYMTSLYTYFVTNVFEYVTQPFLLTLAGITAFIAMTYDKSYIYDLRSRKLWATILSFLLVTIKLTIVLSGLGFWIAELIGFNFAIVYTLAWRMWARSSKKTKVNPPKINKEEKDEKYKYIYIDGRLNSKTNNWLGLSAEKNAYPFIFSEVMKANDEGLTLVLVSESKSSEIYDKGEIVINKSKRIPYVYMEDEDKTHMKDVIEDFENEVKRSN